MTPSVSRIHVSIPRHAADGNIRPGHPAERASWVWAPARGPHETAVLRFSLDFVRTPAEKKPIRLHVTADHRYQLFLDDELISCGPDRCDVEHWAVTTLDIVCAPGPHRLTALAWYIAEDPAASRMDPKESPGDLSAANPPMAQMSHRAGFLLRGGEGLACGVLDTGHAPWKVSDVTASVSMRGPRNLGYHDIGPEFTIDLRTWREAAARETDAVVVRRPPVMNEHGVRSPGWVLDSTPLPEQRREIRTGGVIRAIRPWLDSDAPWQESPAGDAAPWQKLLDLRSAITLNPNTAVEVLWDLQRYECGYPHLAWSGGTGARVELAWAESLYSSPPGAELDASSPKGNRDEIAGKRWLGFGDSFIASGAPDEESPALWWRSGRYLRLRLRTGTERLTIHRLAIRTTGYPLDRRWRWTSSDREWDGVLPLLARGLELGAHEIWADSPYYEQLLYVGDNCPHLMSNFVGYRDDRLSRRTLELLDWSRAGSIGGLVAERYPSGWRQESATYAMLWPMMVRNYLMWRGDREFVSALMVGVRQLIEALLALRGKDGLLGTVPGWPFVDWVTSWPKGCGPGVCEGDSSIVNLHLVLALQAAAEMEHAIGEPILARRYDGHARAMMRKVVARYWDKAAGVLRDTTGASAVSEHAQVLALLTNLLDARRAASCTRALVEERTEAKCTIYFSFYLLEALARAGEANAFFSKLAFWRRLPSMGFKALPEAPDPCRSDCHGWGAHPLFHTFASIAGVRPAAPGMGRVRIAPMPGPLRRFRAELVHPRGKITVEFHRSRSGIRFAIGLPAGVTGELHWNGKRRVLSGSGKIARIVFRTGVKSSRKSL
jgi:hypothetical protein